MIAPRTVREAWCRRRASKNLYVAEWDETLLDRNMDEIRAQLDLA
ncbi:MAG: hypothetical protein ACPGVZ_10820 [Myxococcota bacterium]